MEENNKSPQAAGTASEVEEKLLLYAIKHSVESILLRDKYIRVIITFQLVLLLFILFK